MAGDRTVLLTGCARGIGRAIAETRATNGWRVVATYNTSLDEVQELVRRRGVHIRQIDLTDRARTIEFAHQIREEFTFCAVTNAAFLEKQPLSIPGTGRCKSESLPRSSLPM